MHDEKNDLQCQLFVPPSKLSIQGEWRGGGGPRTMSYGRLEILSNRRLKYLPLPQECYHSGHGELELGTNTRVTLYTLVNDRARSPELC